MKSSKNLSGFRNRRLEIPLMSVALACLLCVGNPQPVVADAPVLNKAAVKAPVKTKIKVLTPFKSERLKADHGW